MAYTGISGIIPRYHVTFNQFLIDDDEPTLIHTGPIGMYDNIADKGKEVVPLEKLRTVAFLHFESDEWGGMDFLKATESKTSLQRSQFKIEANWMA